MRCRLRLHMTPLVFGAMQLSSGGCSSHDDAGGPASGLGSRSGRAKAQFGVALGRDATREPPIFVSLAPTAGSLPKGTRSAGISSISGTPVQPAGAIEYEDGSRLIAVGVSTREETGQQLRFTVLVECEIPFTFDIEQLGDVRVEVAGENYRCGRPLPAGAYTFRVLGVTPTDD
jgi:hypothetical protein